MSMSGVNTPKIHDLLKMGLSHKEIKEIHGVTDREISRTEMEFGRILPEKELREHWIKIIPEIKRRFREEILEMGNNS